MVGSLLILWNLLCLFVPNHQLDKPNNLDVYLLIGQSNMAGRAEIELQDQDTLNNVFLFTGDAGNPWEKAANPLNKYSTIRKKISMQKLSMAYTFAREISRTSDNSVGLVVNARGGTRIEAWLPGTKYYKEAVARTKEAVKYGELKGIVWHQGEGNVSNYESYPTKLKTLIEAFRMEFDLPDLPFVAGQLSEDKPPRKAFNQMILKASTEIKSTAVALTEGTSTFDSTHFDSRSQRLLGERYAAEMRILLAGQSAGAMHHIGGNKDIIPYKKAGRILPKNSKEITASPFGIQAGTLVDSLVARAAEIGVKWTRLGASWDAIEKEKGVYDWSETDKAFDISLKNGIVPFITIGHGNKLYSKLTTYDDPKLAEIYGYRPEPPIKDQVAMKAFLAFTKATVERYKDKIDYWEVWNEPNHRNYWGATPDGKEYGDLLVQTAKVIKDTDPGSKVIGGSMAGINPEFTDDFLSVGGDQVTDIISYHNYGAVPETRVYKAIELWEVINKYNPAIELWQGECGYPSHSSSRDYRGRAPWGLNIQAKWLLRQSFVDTYFCKATLSNYFKLVHTSGRGDKQERSNLRPIDKIFGFPERGGSRVRTKGVNEKCLLTNPEFDRKPAFYAYQNLCAVWQPSYKPNVVGYDIKVTDPGIFYGIGEEDDAFPSVPLLASFSGDDNKNLVAWWLPWNAQEYLPELARIDIELMDIQFLDPVMLDPLTGDVYDIQIENNNEGCRIREAVLADYPMIVVERATINLKK